MVQVLVLTQFAFLTLGVVMLKILMHAYGNPPQGTFLDGLDAVSLWLLAIPAVWGFFGRMCEIVNRGPLKPAVAKVIGVVLAVACAVFPLTMTFYF